MSTNRKPIARRHHGANELQAWSAYLSYGVDYFRALSRQGLSDAEMKKLAPDVWRRHAQRFMAGWRADGEKGLPWAARQFGEP